MTSLALVVVLGVGFRKFGAALVWYDEVASVLLAWLTYYGACLAALKRAHIGFPTLLQALPRRVRIALTLVGEVFVVAFFLVAAWAGWRVLVVLGGTSLISLPSVPTRLTQSVIPIGATLFVVAQLLSLPHVIRGDTAASVMRSPGGVGGPPGEGGTEAGAHPGEDGTSGDPGERGR